MEFFFGVCIVMFCLDAVRHLPANHWLRRKWVDNMNWFAFSAEMMATLCADDENANVEYHNQPG